MASSKIDNTVAPQLAGYILQLERALYHLAAAAADVSVAVEYVDDVVLLREGKVIVQEQDKNSVKPRKQILGDRSKALWRTLQIWLSQRNDPERISCERYLLVTSNEVNAPIASLLKGILAGSVGVQEAIDALRAQGVARSRSDIQAMINSVLEYTDSSLRDLISRIEIIDGPSVDHCRSTIANGLAIDPRIDSEIILDGLLGWLTRTLKEDWQAGRPGMISRASCVRQCRELERLQARRRFLPRPARDIPVGPTERAVALARPFVEHLSRIEAEEEDVLQAVEHFVQFNVEKHRLAIEGDVADREWRDRSDRLCQRWRNIRRSARMEDPNASASELGRRILIQSTYHHHEPLGGQPCDELYMTSGHYHRLADDDEVWWDPTYKTEGKQ
ncbi:ABC-three component system protein [Bradyrhizobium sp. RT3b]|uniref:ABC-three component system protein n=1 Tax=Bradyrhizobium sp. RT3b TaxID=3156334 RepID=UPI003394DCB2